MRRNILSNLAALVALGMIIGACGEAETSTTTPGLTTTTTVSTTTTTSPETQTVMVAFATGDGSDCAQVTSYPRQIDAALDPVRSAFDMLVAGPTVEEMALGASSVFADDSSGALWSVVWYEYEKLLIVDFRDVRSLLSNASTSCGSQSLLAQLNTTAFQFEEVVRVRYEMDGSCDIFSEWLQSECMEYTRAGGEVANLSTNERALGSGCTPGTAVLPDGRWFGYVTDATETSVTFDLACWFSGSAAADAAAEDGEESPPPNDYYIRNQNEMLREVPVASGTFVTWLPTGDPADATTTSYEEWLAERPDRFYLPGVWLEITAGQVVLIDEQYVP